MYQIEVHTMHNRTKIPSKRKSGYDVKPSSALKTTDIFFESCRKILMSELLKAVIFKQPIMPALYHTVPTERYLI